MKMRIFAYFCLLFLVVIFGIASMQGSGAGVAGSLRTSQPIELQINKGNLPGHSIVIIRGHNPTQTAASGSVDIAEMGNLTYLTSAETMNLVSTSTSDTSAGIGIRTVLIQGLDSSWDAIQEVVTMNGTSNVLTSNSYLRVNSLIGLTAGSSGWNVGDVTATASSAATVQDKMGATESLSQSSHYTIPLGFSGYLKLAEFNAAKASGGGTPEIEFRAYVRQNATANAAWVQLFDKKMDTAVVDQISVIAPYAKMSAQTDIRFRADTDTNGTEVRTRLTLILIEDGF